MVRSMMMLGVVTTMSGLRVEFSKTLLTWDVWPDLVMVLTISASTESWRRPIAGRLLQQWLVTWEVDSTTSLHLRHFVLGAARPIVPNQLGLRGLGQRFGSPVEPKHWPRPMLFQCWIYMGSRGIQPSFVFSRCFLASFVVSHFDCWQAFFKLCENKIWYGKKKD